MTPEQDLYTALTGDGTVTGYVGARIYADRISQDDPRPAIVYQRLNTRPETTIHGAQYGYFASLAVIVHAVSRSQADAIMTAILAALESAGFWQDQQGSDYEPELDSASASALFTQFYTG